MKKIFYTGLLALVIYEIANVYFIMPMPGSQQMNSIDLAYFLYKWRWIFRSLFTLILIIGLLRAQWKRKWTLAIPLIAAAILIYFINFKMAADAMFTQPKTINLSNAAGNKVDSNRLIIGVFDNGIAKAYPIQFLGYHHFVYDTINSKNILVTYCTVCRTGRVFEPVVNGKLEKFRLVGMDHFNAMIEDATTKSWWQQATGKAIAGKLKGSKLKEVHSMQTSLAQWLSLYPNSTVMQADPATTRFYSANFDYESGKSNNKLTGTDSSSWHNKSWVVGVKLDSFTKTFDWNELKQKRILQGKIGNSHAFVILAKDDKSFFAYENIFTASPELINDTIHLNNKKYKLDGTGTDTSHNLTPLNAYQEFWHSWKYFSDKSNDK
ncbi:MAG: DUF3179 domain-containing protein [Rhizobacter sp.]|nr:DUF3179 domain-containing protein [Ferruginibacter sp.]